MDSDFKTQFDNAAFWIILDQQTPKYCKVHFLKSIRPMFFNPVIVLKVCDLIILYISSLIRVIICQFRHCCRSSGFTPCAVHL